MGYYEGQTKETTQKDVLKTLCGVFFLMRRMLSSREREGYGAEALNELMFFMDEHNPVMIYAGY